MTGGGAPGSEILAAGEGWRGGSAAGSGFFPRARLGAGLGDAIPVFQLDFRIFVAVQCGAADGRWH